jgi:hypothetical protein
MPTVFDQSIVIALSPNSRTASVLFDTAVINFKAGDGSLTLSRRAPLRIMGEGEIVQVHAHGFLTGAKKARVSFKFGNSKWLRLGVTEGNWAASGAISLTDNAETLRVRLSVDAPTKIDDVDGVLTLDSLDLILSAKA